MTSPNAAQLVLVDKYPIGQVFRSLGQAPAFQLLDTIHQFPPEWLASSRPLAGEILLENSMHFTEFSIGHEPRFSQNPPSVRKLLLATVEYFQAGFQQAVQIQFYIRGTFKLNDDASSANLLTTFPAMHKFRVVSLNLL
jgi:hypothetical protein